jgi:putative hydrolase of the HAD superfamily
MGRHFLARDRRMSTLRAVLFDYGHTFLNFAPAEEALLAAYEEIRVTLQAEARSELPDARGLIDSITRRVGRAVFESYERQELDELDILAMFETALVAMGLSLSRDRIHELAVMEHRAFVSELFVPPENLAVLARLREWGLKIGLVSNAHFLPEMMREDIERLGIARYVDAGVFSSELGVRKPHPAIFRAVLGELQVEPSEAIFVGDRVKDDIGGAQDVGLRGVLTREFRQEEWDGTGVTPDHVIDRLPDLLPYVEGLLSVA